MDLGAAAEGIGEALHSAIRLGSFALLFLGAMVVSVDMILTESPSRVLVFTAFALLVAGGGLILVNEVVYWHVSRLPPVWCVLAAGTSLYIAIAGVRLLRGKSRLAQSGTVRLDDQVESRSGAVV